jgi:ergothioneine biosynthesis protein EgtB
MMGLLTDAEPASPATAASPPELDRAWLAGRYRAVRRQSDALSEPLEPEDQVVQSMPDASPTKWHLAHTSWFFETFILAPNVPGYRPFRPEFAFLFNSYYNAIGERIPRARRGLLTRPPLAEVLRYRRHVDEQVLQWLDRADEDRWRQAAPILVLGLHHEQQHQELILTDIKHAFGSNPLRPAYRPRERADAAATPPMRWIPFAEGVRRVGHDGDGFAFDNERPRHRQFVASYRLASRPVTNGEYRAFIEDRGYDRPEFWLADGWDARRTQDWTAPLYWEPRGDGWWTLTLAGMEQLDEAEPVCHVSFYEADAFARWSGARLPTEAEWEHAAADVPLAGNFLEGGRLHPAPAPADGAVLSQLFGDVWEWTQSPYTPYPGYRPAPGALGEYNGKFMCNQMVLRGGSCATPQSHIRPSYRNFFPPAARWQFTGIRLANDEAI